MSATPRLPILSTGRNFATTGTYMAEKKSKIAVDLVSESSVPSHNGKLPRILERNLAGQPKKRHAFEKNPSVHVHPALKSIEPLLLEAEKGCGDTFTSLANAPGSLGCRHMNPAICSHKASMAHTSTAPEWVRDVYPGRSDTRIGDRETSVPTDLEFLSWCTLPAKQGSNKHDKDRSRPESIREVRHLPESVCASPQASPCPVAWNICLLRKTYDNELHTEQDVARCLSNVLGIDAASAEQKASTAQTNLFVIVATCTAKEDALRKSQKLLEQGLKVALASDLDDVGRAVKKGTKKNRVSKVTEQNSNSVFRKGYQGTDLEYYSSEAKVKHMLIEQQQLAFNEKKSCTSWQNLLPDPQVMPLDAVEAYFESEHDRMKLRKACEAGDSLPPLSPKDASKNRKVKTLLSRHLTSSISVISSSPRSGHEPTSELEKHHHKESHRHVSHANKELCILLRQFVFGAAGNEHATGADENEHIFAESIGDKANVLRLSTLWQKLDNDHSGRVDMGEFRAFAEQGLAAVRRIVNAHATRGSVPLDDISSPEPALNIAKLCDKLEKTLLGRKSSFAIEDLMKLIWLRASASDIRTMKQWIKEYNDIHHKVRVNTPPVLPRFDYEALVAVFRTYDINNDNHVSMEELLANGMLDEEQVECFKIEHNEDGKEEDGANDEGAENQFASLDLHDFCDLMCPDGFRAHGNSTHGSLPDGTRIMFDPFLPAWRLRDVPSSIAII